MVEIRRKAYKKTKTKKKKTEDAKQTRLIEACQKPYCYLKLLKPNPKADNFSGQQNELMFNAMEMPEKENNNDGFQTFSKDGLYFFG